MPDYDILIVGGGMAGSTAAAMLGGAGFKIGLIDPHEAYPPDFRCEKLDASQIALLRKTGFADAILSQAFLDLEIWIARYGRLLGKRLHQQCGIAYPTLVNAMRDAIPKTVERIIAKAASFSLTADQQTVTLSNSREITARLVVMANGLNTGLRQTLGIGREVISPMHSISIGFDLRPVGGARFAFDSLTYGPESPASRIAYLTLFPIGGGMRANFFVYRDMRDVWLKKMRDSPRETLLAALPGLGKLMGNFEVTSFVQIRPVDLYVTTGIDLPGIVLIGDAFATSCPAAGTGLNKVLTDVERLCHVHIPSWFASDGMAAEKIAAYYTDPEKVACDRYSTEKAQRLRSLSIDTALAWRARRWARFLALYGAFRLRDGQRALARLSARGNTKQNIGSETVPGRASLAMAGADLQRRDSNA
jgi:2-polyprenyl-6-methoxyphenol hydroxylase-like FAD-dependent oxidoreductase